MEVTEAVQQIVVSDAGPLIHLDEIGCLPLLSDFTKVLVPDAVWIEVTRHRPAALAHQAVPLVRVTLSMPTPPQFAELARLFSLHQGEVEALQLASQQPIEFLLTDDTAARLAARQIGVAVHGTIGVLLRSIRSRQRTATEVVEILSSLPAKSTLHLKKSLLDEIVRNVEQAQ
jgi:predicted nucleic acid-binding protein